VAIRRRKKTRARRAIRDAMTGRYVLADVRSMGHEDFVREYIGPKSSSSIRRTERTYAKALKSLAKR
jgi:hypothetical protein